MQTPGLLPFGYGESLRRSPTRAESSDIVEVDHDTADRSCETKYDVVFQLSVSNPAVHTIFLEVTVKGFHNRS